jgi:hypothetical protein
MDGAWVRNAGAGEDYCDWYIAMGSGMSIRHRAAPLPLTKRLVHHFLRAPEGYSIEQALRWGQVHAFGGDAKLAEAIAATRIGDRFEHEAFWASVVRFFVVNPTLDRSQVGPIVDYLQAQRFEERDAFVRPGVRERLPPAHPHLSMSGRCPAALLRSVEQWHRELARSTSAGNRRWERSGIGEFELETGTPGKSLRIWRIRELCSSDELRQEGARMRHCVAAYTRSCAAGSTSIWTLELQGYEGVTKHQTIEVNRNGVIVQCRGRCNTLPSPREREIVRRWAAQEGLQIGRMPGWV